MRVVLYARVSTRDQTAENQLQPLRQYAAARGLEVLGEYVDAGISGAKEQRPGLDQVMTLARARTVDAVVVAAFDRFGRSLAHLVRALEEFQHLGVGFISLREQLDFFPCGRPATASGPSPRSLALADALCSGHCMGRKIVFPPSAPGRPYLRARRPAEEGRR